MHCFSPAPFRPRPFSESMRSIFLFTGITAALTALLPASSIEEDWNNPPPESRLRAYWWWLNSNVTREAITSDLEGMKKQGFGGALIFDAGGAEQRGNAQVPAGPAFMSPEWRELYKHALREADRLGIELSLNIQSGWNLGGPPVKVEDAAKKLVWSETKAQGPDEFSGPLPTPGRRHPWYQDLFVVAVKVRPDPKDRPPVTHLAAKALLKPLSFSSPDTSMLLQDIPGTPGEEDAEIRDVIDLTSRFSADGHLKWEIPEGHWRILRFGCTVGDHATVSTSSAGWNGYALDVYDKEAFRAYWDAVVKPLVGDAGALAGKTLKYLHTDSWEIEAASWTPTLREEFKRRRGYDLVPWLPVLAGYILDSRESTNRLLFDFRKTMGELAIDHHYRPFSEWAHEQGLLIHPESGGPHASPFDAQACLGINDIPMSEFWAPSPHRVGDQNRFFVKQPAGAAHTNGHKLVMAEGFTTLGPHWQETLWDQLKPTFDKACTEGLNRLAWHAFVCSPDSTGIPGQQYFAGTHLNPKVTWWSRGGPFFTYLNRCQMMLQRGLPVADVLCYYGDHVPNFSQLRSSDPAKVGAGFDYDVIAEETLLTRLSVKDGRLVLPDGVSYRVLALPDRPAISLPVLKKVRELVEAGATVTGGMPNQASGLTDSVKRDAEVRRLAEELWEGSPARRVHPPTAAREILLARGIQPDFGFTGGSQKAEIHYIHRTDHETEIYFVASRGTAPESIRCTFRVSGKAPELWNPVTGERRFAGSYEENDGRTTLAIDFAPCGSWFVIFRSSSAHHPPVAGAGNAPPVLQQELTGPWTVSFDPKWGGPATTVFKKLESWTTHQDRGIKYYSGTATYRYSFDLKEAPHPGQKIHLDLGEVKEIAEIRLNSQPLGILWSPPFQVEITKALKPSDNHLEVDVVNFWPNRIIGDSLMPEQERFTKTNIRTLTGKSPLMDSGLLGPVRILSSGGQD